MEMAKYIMQILKSQLMVVCSWGFHNATAIENGIRFSVQGFKFRGTVEVRYNEGRDLFDVSFCRGNKLVEVVDGVYLDSLVEVIDNFVEKTSDYEKRVREEYQIKVY